MSGETSTDRAELVAIQVALARGYIQQQDLREAVSIHQRLQLDGQRRGLLAVLGDSYLDPEHLPELRAVYEQALQAAGAPATGSKAPGSDRLDRTRADRPSDQGPVHDAPTRGPKRQSEGSHKALSSSNLGRYELREELGRGGMGVVYRAHDPELGRDVALKVLAADATNPEEKERFKREARAAASLRHPHVVRVLDVAIGADPPYLVMDLVEGESLKARLHREGPWDLRRAVELVRKMASALAEAHDMGMIHRDVKPGNVLLDPAGEPYLTDFGLARRVDGFEQRLTKSGDVVGTPHYMSPEQARGDKGIDGRTDIWSLGALFYHMLAGQPPLKEQSLIEHMKALMNKDPEPPSRQRPEIPPELDRIVLRCLTREVSDRYPDARTLVADLDRFLAPPQPDPEESAPPGAQLSFQTVAVALLSFATVGLLLLLLLRPEPPPARTTAPPPTPSPPVTPRAETPTTPTPSPAEELRLRAERLESQGAHQEAIEALRQLVQLVPNDADALARRAEILAATGQMEEALADVTVALRLFPTSIRYLRLRARLLLHDHTEDAVEDLKIAWSHAQRGPESEAVKGEYLRALYKLSNQEATLGQLIPANALAQRALELDRESPFGWAALSRVLVQRRDHPGAEKAADEALAREQELGTVAQAVAHVRFNRGMARQNQGKAQEALADYDFVVQHTKEPADLGMAFFVRGRLRKSLGDLKGAHGDLGQALDVLPADHTYRANAGAMRQEVEELLKQQEGLGEKY